MSVASSTTLRAATGAPAASPPAARLTLRPTVFQSSGALARAAGPRLVGSGSLIASARWRDVSSAAWRGGDDLGSGPPLGEPSEEMSASLLSRLEDKAVGAEYGEGLQTFRLDGGGHLDVDTLNEHLQLSGAHRMRVRTIAPDEAHGMIFNFEGVVADTTAIQRQAWEQVAEEEGYKLPEFVRPQVYGMRAERVVTEVFHWTRDWAVARRIAWRMAELYSENFGSLDSACEGLEPWLEALAKARVPCAVVSSMDGPSLDAALERMGLEHAFEQKVSATDECDTLAQSYLIACLKMGRPPCDCVVFGNSPQEVTAAHNCRMKSVAVLGAYKAYELKSADLTCASPDELTVYNMRRLFAEKGYEFMDRGLQVAGMKKPPTRFTTAATI